MTEHHQPQKLAVTVGLRSAAAAVACIFSIYVLDGPIARILGRGQLFREAQRFAVATWLIASVLAFALLVLAFWSFKTRKLPRVGEAFLLASISSLIGIAINPVLKFIFGRKVVVVYLYHNRAYGFFPFHGNAGESFPSGHMVIAAAVVTILWQYFPRWRLLYVALLACVSFLLLVGQWHFFSDLIAGFFLGNILSLLVQRLWMHRVAARAG